MTDIISVTINEDSIVIVKREKSNIMYTCNPPRLAEDIICKEIYEVVNGKITYIGSISILDI